MKTKLTLLFLIISLVSNIFGLKAQVTIGMNETPEKYASLQIKDRAIDKLNESLDSKTAEKGGLLLPRVVLEEKKELFPFITQTEIDADPAAYADLKLLHTGLIVFNLTEDDEKELCRGMNQWDGEKWNCLQNKLGNAVAELGNCDSLKFLGVYQNDVMLDGTNYMLIPLHVTKAGAYTITATVKDAETNTDDNGYFFTVTGVFMSTGYYYIKVDGAGTPIEFTPSGNLGDYATVTFNNKELSGETAGCQKRIFVEDSSVKPIYTIDCRTVTVHGFGVLDQPLLPSTASGKTTYISVTVNVDAAAVGAFYEIKTDKVAGMSFYAKGNFTASGQQTVILEPVDPSVPTATGYQDFVISTNSISTGATCKASVLVGYTKKKLLTISDCWNWWGFGPGKPTAWTYTDTGGSYYVTKSAANFGLDANSTFKVEEIEIVERGGYINAGLISLPAATLKQLIKDQNIDIIQFSVRYNPDAAISAVLLEFMQNGGVVIAMMDNANSGKASAQTLLRTVFNNSSITVDSANDGGALYKFKQIDDEVLNGPFMDLRGKFWGEDTTASLYAIGLPQDEIIPYSTIEDFSGHTGSSTIRPSDSWEDLDGLSMFRHKTLPFIWIGDGGFLAQGGVTLPKTSVPFTRNMTTGQPTATSGYGRNSAKKTVYNSHAWCNILAWAIKTAQR